MSNSSTFEPRITLDYWRIWFYVLEEAGLDVQLVNASQARNLPGRPKTDLLTEPPDVAAAQEAQPSPRPIIGVSDRSRSPGRASHVASLIATETGHTVLNHLPSFSSLPIFDLSRGGP